MTITTIPCDPPEGSLVGEHCDCWTWGDPCCWCHNDEDLTDGHLPAGCPQ